MACVLIVNQTDCLRKILADILRYNGHRTDEAADGLQALECFSARRYDAVVVDEHLPELDGLEVCRRLRGEYAAQIVMLSSSNHPCLRERALANGVSVFLPKPMNIGHLVSWINSLNQCADERSHV
jgi:DNA-binding response OmpR family regulator